MNIKEVLEHQWIIKNAKSSNQNDKNLQSDIKLFVTNADDK